MWTVEIVVMGVMIAFNSVFAAYEIALASIGLSRLDTLAQERRRGAASALRMRTNMEASLAVVQLGITLVGAVAAATGGAGAAESIEPWLVAQGVAKKPAQFVAIALVVLPLTVVTIVLGELVPKVFALRNKEWVCLKLSPIMEWFGLCVWPAVWLFETSVSLIMRLAERRWSNKDTEETLTNAAAMQELQAIAALARTSRLIGRREESIIVSAARLSSTAVRRIMLPAEYITMLHVKDSMADALVAAHHDMHTRFPVCENPDDPQSIIGYVNFKDVVATLRLSPRNPSLSNIIRPLSSFDEDASVSECLERLIREHNHIALVRSEHGEIVGLVTLEDIIEELVGEIHDEYDRLPAHIVPTGGGWIIGGNAPLGLVKQATGLDLQPPGERPVNTLNEWVVEHLGRPVDKGEEILIDGYRLLVRKIRRQFVLEAQLSRDE